MNGNRDFNAIRQVWRFGVWGLAFTVWGLAVSSATAGPQASITLKNSDAALCHQNDTAWTLTKDSDVGAEVDSGATVSWTVSVTRGLTTDSDLAVYGFMQVTNTGSAPATIGNILVNLQRTRFINKKTGSKWVSASVNVADATSGDAATSVNILAAASQENVAWNLQHNIPATYAVTSPRGTFFENAASGALTFTDADSNDVWAISPQKVIAIGETVNLLFQAHFNNTILGIPAGEQVRAEVIVSFGNAGARGGSGAMGKHIDINGNGSNDLDEANIRSVPTRLTRTVPALEACNDSVYLSDFVEDVSTTGDATFDENEFSGLSGEAVSADGTFFVSVGPVDGGEAGGSITNTAHLDGVSDGVSVIIGYDSVFNETTMIYDSVPIYYDFPCCVGVDIDAANTVTVLAGDVPPPPVFAVDDYCTYLRNAFGDPSGGPTPTDAQVLYAMYSTVFPSGLTIGVNDGAGASHHAFWNTASVGNGGIARLRTYLHNAVGGGNPNGALAADTSNANSTSGGELAKQTATLTLNVVFSDAGVAGDSSLLPFGVLYLCDLAEGDMIGSWTLTAAQAAALNGKTVEDILEAANVALGTGAMPYYVDPAAVTFDGFDELNELVTTLNLSFNNCVPSGFAQAHLCPKPGESD